MTVFFIDLQKTNLYDTVTMHRFGRVPTFLFVTALLIACAHVRTNEVSAYFSMISAETHELRAVDTLPPAIPAIKETENRSESRILIEELIFAAVIGAVLLPKERWHHWVRHTRHPRPTLSKYLRSIRSRQTIK